MDFVIRLDVRRACSLAEQSAARRWLIEGLWADSAVGIIGASRHRVERERPPCDPCGEASGRCEVGDITDVPAYNALILVARAPGFHPQRSDERPVDCVGSSYPRDLESRTKRGLAGEVLAVVEVEAGGPWSSP